MDDPTNSLNAMHEPTRHAPREIGGPVAPASVAHAGSPGWVHALLLLATLATTTWAGALHQGINILTSPADWTRGLPYALALLAVLGVHEMGHYLMARRRGVRVSLPYFIPAPFWLGTFGAFIKMRDRIRDRATYFDVGIAGPLAGLVVAIAAMYLGMLFERPTAAAGHGLSPASSYLFAVVHLVTGGTDLATPVELGPVAFAGWLGLFVTALNLLPVGQLDGGHIAYAVLGPAPARHLSVAVVALLIASGLLLGSHLVMWGLVVWFIAGLGHPPAADMAASPGRGRAMLAALSALLLLAILLPVPV